MMRFLSLLVNAFIFATVFIVSTRLTLRFNEKGLPTGLDRSRLRLLKFFTVQANLAMGLIALAYHVALTLALCGVTGGVPDWIGLAKYLATTAVLLTLVMVVFYIGPRASYRDSFVGGNFWFHLVVPLAAAIDYCLLEREGAPSFPMTFAALAPAVLYGAAYLLNLRVRGFRGDRQANDWYQLVSGRVAFVPLKLAAILAVDWCIAAALWAVRR